MKEFSWTIEYTLNLTYPVFLGLTDMLHRIRLDSAVDEFYTPYGAAKYGGKCSKALFDGRGSFYLGNVKKKHFENEEVTPEMIEKANEKLRKIMEDRRNLAARMAKNA